MMNIDWSKAPVNACAFLSPKSHAEGAFYAQSLRWESSTGLLNGCKVDGSRFCVNEDNWDVYREDGKPAPWTGEGLPPVGVACEIHHACWALNDWQQTDIKYISSDYLIVGGGAFKSEQHFHMSDMSFRPARTAEQIKAEEREAAVAQMVEVIHQRRFSGGCTPSNPQEEAKLAAEALYDGLYRKQEQK